MKGQFQVLRQQIDQMEKAFEEHEVEAYKKKTA